MLKKMSICLLILSLICFNLLAADYDLVKEGSFLPLVDETGTVQPDEANSDQLHVREAKQSIIKVTWTLKPDKENGGEIWTWGDLRGYLQEDEKTFDCSKVKVELEYSATTEISVLIEQKSPKIIDEGSEFMMRLPATKGEYKTVTLDLGKFSQPDWTQKKITLNLEELVALGFQPIIPKGGECELKIKSCVFVGLSNIKG